MRVKSKSTSLACIVHPFAIVTPCPSVVSAYYLVRFLQVLDSYIPGIILVAEGGDNRQILTFFHYFGVPEPPTRGRI